MEERHLSVEVEEENERFGRMLAELQEDLLAGMMEATSIQVDAFAAMRKLLGGFNGEQDPVQERYLPFDGIFAHRFIFHQNQKIPVWTLHNLHLLTINIQLNPSSMGSRSYLFGRLCRRLPQRQ